MIDERKKAGPSRRGEAGAAIVSCTGSLVAEIIVSICFCSHVRNIAYGRGSVVGGIGHAGLPTRNREAIVGRAAAAVEPRRF